MMKGQFNILITIILVLAMIVVGLWFLNYAKGGYEKGDLMFDQLFDPYTPYIFDINDFLTVSDDTYSPSSYRSQIYQCIVYSMSYDGVPCYLDKIQRTKRNNLRAINVYPYLDDDDYPPIYPTDFFDNEPYWGDYEGSVYEEIEEGVKREVCNFDTLIPFRFVDITYSELDKLMILDENEIEVLPDAYNGVFPNNFRVTEEDINTVFFVSPDDDFDEIYERVNGNDPDDLQSAVWNNWAGGTYKIVLTDAQKGDDGKCQFNLFVFYQPALGWCNEDLSDCDTSVRLFEKYRDLDIVNRPHDYDEDKGVITYHYDMIEFGEGTDILRVRDALRAAFLEWNRKNKYNQEFASEFSETAGKVKIYPAAVNEWKYKEEDIPTYDECEIDVSEIDDKPTIYSRKPVSGELEFKAKSKAKVRLYFYAETDDNYLILYPHIAICG